MLVLNNGDGADALLLEVTDAMPTAAGRKGLAGHLLQKRQLPNYTSLRPLPPADGAGGAAGGGIAGDLLARRARRS